MISAIFAAILLAQAAPPAAQAPAPTPAIAAPAAALADVKPDAAKVTKVHRDDLLCKEEPVIGSRFPKKVCYTREQQEDRTQQDQNTMNRLQSQFGILSH